MKPGLFVPPIGNLPKCCLGVQGQAPDADKTGYEPECRKE